MQNYTWRAVQADDLGVLADLDAACRTADGPASVPEPAYAALLGAPATTLTCAVTADDTPVAVGWVQGQAAQARIGGRVHPQHRRRGLGNGMLRWAEAQASSLGAPSRLIIRNETLTDSSAALYTQAGYQCDFAEHWLQRDLRGALPETAAPLPTVPWSADSAPQFFAAYSAAFQTRPGFVAPPAAEWISDNADDPEFRPDLSLVALAAGGPVGFVTAGVVPLPAGGPTVGWVSQIGVDPAWRGRGVATGLLAAVMAAFAHAGFSDLGLHVNANNANAIALYTRLGFQPIGQRAKYSKALP
ncbi:MAG: GNAT family N-acetyltransferase [Chloroflexota bacterium]|nr:GNAT family N-acetyltransferase [Chloroflexota bacterium]